MGNWMALVGLSTAVILTGCFRNSKDAQGSEEMERMPQCGVVDGRDLTEMKYADPPTVFKAKCATCHHPTKDGTGPALAGFMKNAPSEEWFKKFVRNEQGLLEAGDSLAIEIQKLKPTKGAHFQKLSDAELDELIEFLK